MYFLATTQRKNDIKYYHQHHFAYIICLTEANSVKLDGPSGCIESSIEQKSPGDGYRDISGWNVREILIYFFSVLTIKQRRGIHWWLRDL